MYGGNIPGKETTCMSTDGPIASSTAWKLNPMEVTMKHPLQKFAKTKEPKVVRMKPGEKPEGKLTEVSSPVFNGIGGGKAIKFNRGEVRVASGRLSDEE
jgi:hypothetical protein